MSENIWHVTDASDHTQATRIRDCCSQIKTGSDIHPWNEKLEMGQKPQKWHTYPDSLVGDWWHISNCTSEVFICFVFTHHRVWQV